MDENTNDVQSTPPEQGQSSETKVVSTPQTYTVGTPEYKKHIDDLLSQKGRDWKAKEAEFKTLASESGWKRIPYSSV